MKLDPFFETEFRSALNGDGSREYAFSVRRELIDIAGALESHHRVGDVDTSVVEHGRAKVLACVAATIMLNPHDYELDQIQWAGKVVALWTNKTPSSISAAAIRMHPAILMDRTGWMRRLTFGGDS